MDERHQCDQVQERRNQGELLYQDSGQEREGPSLKEHEAREAPEAALEVGVEAWGGQHHVQASGPSLEGDQVGEDGHPEQDVGEEDSRVGSPEVPRPQPEHEESQNQHPIGHQEQGGTSLQEQMERQVQLLPPGSEPSGGEGLAHGSARWTT